MAFGFEARRVFKGVIDQHQRTSDESMLLENERKAAKLQMTGLGQTGGDKT